MRNARRGGGGDAGGGVRRGRIELRRDWSGLRRGLSGFVSRNLIVGVGISLYLTGGCASNDPGGGRPSRKQELANAYAAFEHRHYDEAIAAAERVLAADSVGPGSAEALYLQGRVAEQRAKEA